METGIILLGHGSRSKDAQLVVNDLVVQIKRTGLFDFVTGAMLQFNKPDLAVAMSEVVSMGVKKIIVVPLFIFKGIHMQEDIPEILEQERKKYPMIEIQLANNIGSDDRLTDILIDRIREVI